MEIKLTDDEKQAIRDLAISKSTYLTATNDIHGDVYYVKQDIPKTILAKQLNGCEYREELTDEQEKFAKENNLVIAFIHSDDLLEFRGAFFEEFGASDLFFNKEMSLFCYKQYLTKSDFDSDNIAYMENSFKLNLSNQLEILRGKEIADNTEQLSFSFKTSFPHEKFLILDNGLPYAHGIIFSKEDLV